MSELQNIPSFLLNSINLDEGFEGSLFNVAYAYYNESTDHSSRTHMDSWLLSDETDPDGRLRELVQQIKDNAEEIINEHETFLRANQ